jgi:hypothetical protein
MKGSAPASKWPLNSDAGVKLLRRIGDKFFNNISFVVYNVHLLPVSAEDRKMVPDFVLLFFVSFYFLFFYF